jgi:hypothetical protein
MTLLVKLVKATKWSQIKRIVNSSSQRTILLS